MKRTVIVFFVLFLLAQIGFAQSVDAEQRGFMFGLGLGIATTSYPAELDAIFSALEAAGINRYRVGVQLVLGYAILPKVYWTLGVYGTGDRLEDSVGDFLQLNTYVYGPGVRIYPFDTGLLVGVDVGASRQLLDDGSNVIAFPWGYGGRLVAAYDFARERTGSGVALGVDTSAALIDGDIYSSISAFLQFLWK